MTRASALRILRHSSFQAGASLQSMSTYCLRVSSRANLVPWPEQHRRHFSISPQLHPHGNSNRTYAINELGRSRVWVDLAGLDPKNSRAEAQAWEYYGSICLDAYNAAEFDLHRTWSAQLPQQRYWAMGRIVDTIGDDEYWNPPDGKGKEWCDQVKKLRKYPGLKDKDLIMYKLSRLHGSRRDYMSMLLQKGAKQRSYSKQDYVPIYSTDKNSKYGQWFLKEDSERSKGDMEGPRILNRAEYKMEREKERLQKELGRNRRKASTEPDDLVSGDHPKAKNKSHTGNRQSMSDDSSQSNTMAG